LAPPLTDAPPTYVPSQPHILVAPLPDSASFFWGRTVQGEVFVKGLGDRKGNRGVKSLYVSNGHSGRWVVETDGPGLLDWS
jgi:hypothetical protein